MTLREVFEHYGVTQHDLVERLAMKRQYAFMLWHDERRLGHRLGKRISAEFGIPLEFLLYPEEQKALPAKQESRASEGCA